jgi:hypothetical protein
LQVEVVVGLVVLVLAVVEQVVIKHLLMRLLWQSLQVRLIQ